MLKTDRQKQPAAGSTSKPNMPAPAIPDLQVALFEHQKGNHTEARALYARVLEHTPDHFDAIHLLGVAEIQCGNAEVGIAHIEAALAIKPDSAEAHNNLGNALKGQGRNEEALGAFIRAIEINPRYPDAFYNKGRLLKELGRLDEAIEAYRSALAINPRHAESSNNLGNLFKARGDFAEAIQAYNQALTVAPRFAEAHNNLGNALKHLGKLDEAVSAYNQAVEIRPQYFEAWANMGVALIEQAKFAEARAAFSRSMEISPDYSEAHWNLSLLQLLTGDFAHGWVSYEWRKRKAQPVAVRDFAPPVWQGEGELNGKTIFVHYEQGLGDTIQFVRYLLLLRALGAIVVAAVQDSLVNLLRPSLPGVLIIGAKQVPEKFDFHVPLLSLPHAFGTRLHTIPAPIPYVRPDPERVERWARLLGPEGFKIGICWQGSTGDIDRGRSFDVSEFRGIGALPGVRLISLHKGNGENQLGSLPEGLHVETLGDAFDPPGAAFADTAAVMANCNLVISSDTSVLHLAGAMGVPVWAALKHIPDWRWLLGRSDSPWYPNMRLFRQDHPGGWSAVFNQMESEIASMIRTAPVAVPTQASGCLASTMPKAPVSWGEVIDKMTILEIKRDNLKNEAAVANVRRELFELDALVRAQLQMTPALEALKADLKSINRALWSIEDDIRLCEKVREFGPRFVELARSVYKTNDERARLKRQINSTTRSELVEEKGYAEYA